MASWAKARMLPTVRSVSTLSTKMSTRVGSLSRISGVRHFFSTAVRKSRWICVRPTSPREMLPLLFFRNRMTSMAS